MEELDSFASDRRFYGDKKDFAYGLERSGEFSLQRAELLQRHGWAYFELTQGIRAPTTRDEVRFVEVFSGKRAPSSEHEKAWQAYLGKTSQRHMVKSPDRVSPLHDLLIRPTYQPASE